MGKEHIVEMTKLMCKEAWDDPCLFLFYHCYSDEENARMCRNVQTLRIEKRVKMD